VLVNAAIADSTASDALDDQVPLAREMHPDVALIWLGTVEVAQQLDPAAFQADLRTVIERVHAAGARVYVADLPPIANTRVTPYNAAIAAAVKATGATLVPLHDRNVTGNAGPGAPLLPDAAGHRTIADAFEAVLRAG
jgi:lysophospholipase L1-like esterase